MLARVLDPGSISSLLKGILQAECRALSLGTKTIGWTGTDDSRRSP